MKRNEHLSWCKKRALEYIELGELNNALVSMYSNLRKHEETENHAGIKLGVMLQIGGHLDTLSKAKKFIEGFN